MKILASSLVAICLTGCVQSHLDETVTAARKLEGRKYTSEIASQSPFKTIEIRWSEAETLLERRNPACINATNILRAASQKPSDAASLTRTVGSTLTSSLGGVAKPGALIDTFRDPAKQLPKQLATLGRIKDIPHDLEQGAWNEMSTVLGAELALRRERVKLQRLLRMGELLDHELQHLPEADESDPAMAAALEEWRATLHEERETWLAEVRDLYDAEYQDVRFIRDASGLPTYRDTEHPDLSDAERWCQLSRSKEIVDALAKSHANDKPLIPGANLVSHRFAGIAQAAPAEARAVRSGSAVRREARTLIKSWRAMKRAQSEAASLESRITESGVKTPEDLDARRARLEHRKTEIEHAAVIWLLDERCWS